MKDTAYSGLLYRGWGSRRHARPCTARKNTRRTPEAGFTTVRNLGKAFAAGVKVAFGTDAAVYPHGLNAAEFSVYVKLGMTPLAAIQTATLNAADLLGWTDRVGRAR